MSPAADSDTWIALDFETATSERHSACALGIAIITGDEITSTHSWLIRPPLNEYAWHNTRIHGIEPEDTADSPTFEELYAELREYLEDRQVLAHWAPFDISVLRALLSYYRLPTPTTRYACSCRMAQRAFPGLHNHQLPTVCGHCGIDLAHHDALSDARACAQVALSCREAVGARSIEEALRELRIGINRL